jgi:hypothetical protein
MSTVDFKECKSCDKTVNNKEFNCPPRMSYGFATDWRPRCSQVYAQLKNAPFTDSLSQRMYLTHNSEELMERNAQNFYNMMNCGACAKPWNQGTMLPEQTEQQCDSRVCTFRTNDPYGLGFARQYYDDNQETEAKRKFIEAKEKEQKYFENVAQCCGTSQDDLKYYPLDGNIQPNYERNAIPSGGTQLSGGSKLNYGYIS